MKFNKKKDNTEKISVIIPNWNRASTLKRAIDSALNQSLPPFEILVCDDGSDDNSNDIVKQYEGTIVKWVAGSRGGRPAIPRNRGITKSKGSLIAFLDSDDEWLPNKLEIQVEHLRSKKCKAVCSNAIRNTPDKGNVGNLLFIKDGDLQLKDLMVGNQVICSSVLIQRELIDAIGGFPEDQKLKVGEDYALWLRAACFTDFYLIGSPLLIYSDDPNNSVRASPVSFLTEKQRVFGSLIRWSLAHNKQSIFKIITFTFYAIYKIIYQKMSKIYKRF